MQSLTNIFASATLYSYECIPSKEKSMKCLKTMAVSAVALEALACLPGVNGGPFTYGLCVGACTFAEPHILPICLALCSIGLSPTMP